LKTEHVLSWSTKSDNFVADKMVAFLHVTRQIFVGWFYKISRVYRSSDIPFRLFGISAFCIFYHQTFGMYMTWLPFMVFLFIKCHC